MVTDQQHLRPSASLSSGGQDKPKVSVVTVTFNTADVVTETMDSVLGQTHPNIEYIVIDGNSTDGTQAIIQTYRDKLAYCVSEPDKGPYDAMNKGIDAATGEWILFMNAGDYFVNSDTVLKVFTHDIQDSVDFVYGDYIWKGDKHEQRIASRPLDAMWQRISFSHQSLFSRTRIMKEKKFDLKYKIVSDYNFYFSCYMEGGRFEKVDMPISVFRAGGLSDINFFKRTFERWKVVTRYKKGPEIHWNYLRLLFNHYKKKI